MSGLYVNSLDFVFSITSTNLKIFSNNLHITQLFLTWKKKLCTCIKASRHACRLLYQYIMKVFFIIYFKLLLYMYIKEFIQSLSLIQVNVFTWQCLTDELSWNDFRITRINHVLTIQVSTCLLNIPFIRLTHPIIY